MCNFYRRTFFTVLLIAFLIHIKEEVNAEELENNSNNELIEYRLKLIEEDLKEKADKETLDSGLIKSLEIDRNSIISDRDFYQSIFTYTISIIAAIFTIFSAINIYRIISTRKVIEESKNAKNEIVSMKDEVNNIYNEVKEANKNFIMEKDQLVDVINEVKEVNEKSIIERDQLASKMTEIKDTTDKFKIESAQIVVELIEEKQKIKERIDDFNVTMESLDDSLKKYKASGNETEFLSEMKEHVLALGEVAADQLDSNMKKIEEGKEKDKEIDAIKVGENEI